MGVSLKNPLPPVPFALHFTIMLFLKDGKDQAAPHAVYLFNDDMEQMVQRKVDGRLRDHGLPVGDRAEWLKDMSFLRSKRLFCEQATRQIWLLIIRGVMIAIGAVMLIGIKEYLTR